jgi:hypothetical protein
LRNDCSSPRRPIAPWFFGWELDEERGAAARAAGELERAAECLDAIAEPDQTRASAEGGSPDSIVADHHAQDRVACLERDLHD